jgi:hypothetical protein
MTLARTPLAALLLCLLSIIPPRSSSADTTPFAKGLIRFSVRTIQADNVALREHDADNYTILTTNADTNEGVISVDKKLEDIRSKLLQLPFSHYQLLSAKEEIITLKKKNKFNLPNGQKLIFRPMYLEGEKVGLWLNWRDEVGKEILNTRLHFDSVDSVVTGTNCGRDEGLVLAIKASAID